MPYHRVNSEFKILKTQHQNVMSDLRTLPKELSGAFLRCKKLSEENKSCRICHSRLLSEWTQLKHEVSILTKENRRLLRKQTLLQQCCEEGKRICEEARETINSPRAKQQQEQEGLEERLEDTTKQKELVTQQRDLAEKSQHHFNDSEMRTQKLQCEQEHATAQDASALQTELLEEGH
ncbi:disks large homolog 5-like [Meriones unguiculatus]|uniref:disks large homolog 5-like n=1 Tax=Meriones unguiculatus TaxID=10047 RepID=UPI00293E848C|nr:disks large homolog 5-like [Meriones unguiculatus]